MKTFIVGFALSFTFLCTVIAQQAFKPVNPQQMQQELSLLKAVLVQLHPGIYRYQTPAQVDSLFAVFQKQIHKELPVNQYYILLSQLLTTIKCGHTYLNPWNQPVSVSNQLFSKSFMPLLYRIIDGRMIVTHNLSGNNGICVGDEITNINGTAIKLIIDSLLTVSRSDGRHGRARQIDNISTEPLDIDTSGYNLFDVYFPLIFPANFNTPRYRLVIKPFRGAKNKVITVNALSKADRLMRFNARYGQLPVHEKNWSLKTIAPKTACLTIGDFETWEWKTDYKKYLDSVFNLLQQKQIKNLVVDIRGNEGGADDARDELFSYLSNKPFGCQNQQHRLVRFLAIPDSLLPYLKTWDRSFKKPKNASDYELTTQGLYESKADKYAPCKAMQPKPTAFKGRLFLVTDARNSSTSFTLARLFRTGTIGTIIGEKTGGNQQGINGGQFFFLNLPHSKIEIDIPLIWGAYAGNNPDDGITPDYTVKTRQQDIYNKKDAQMEFINRLINKL